ncbi:APC family permease [Sphingoaurantiacus capsulatus]|uniref:APC family permease n=1 Tax=Sphingoaurantiacus capsulatus TaxID=1771310 RepID=A0ABV7X8P0_9SPHN
MTADTAAPTLVRALTRRDLAGILLNAMVGAGMLAAPAKVYAVTGGWSFTVLLLSAMALLPLILCFADLGSRFSGTGGPYLYVRDGLGRIPAFAAGWLLWIAQVMSTATLANLFVSYLAGFAPILESGVPRLATIGLLGAVMIGVVIVGISPSARVSNALIVIKVAFVALFLIAGLPFVDLGRVETGATPAIDDFATAMLVYLFAYTGFERGAVLAGEARDPKRDMPAALGISMIVATLAYAAVLLVCIGTLADPSTTDRPLAEAGRLLYGSIGAVAVSAGAITVILGTLFVIGIGMPRVLLALADDGQVPTRFAAIHPRWRTPWIAILLSGVLSYVAAMASDLLTALTISTGSRLISYILSCIALWRLRNRADAPPAMFKLPAGGIIALFTAALFTGVLLLGATNELPALAVVTAGGFVLLLFGKRRAA